MILRSEVSFCVDTLLVETVLADSKFYKKAGFVSDILNGAKGYFDANIDKNNPVASVIDVLAPGALWLLFRSLGLGKWGMLIGLLMDVFHVDVWGLLRSLYSKVKGLISGGQKVSAAQVDSIANESAQEFSQPATPQEAQEGYKALQEKQMKPEGAWADDGKVYSSLELMHDAKIISLALVEYEHQKMRLTKEAISPMSFLSGFSGTKAKSTNILAKIFGWVIKLALASAGLLIAGDVINKAVGRPSALDRTYQRGQETPEVSVPARPISTQTKFKLKADAPLSSTWPLVNTPENIESMLVQFAKDVYSGLDGKESIIRSSPAFQDTKDQLDWFNIHNPGTAVIFIPGNYTSKKQIVDTFIDDVAKSAP